MVVNPLEQYPGAYNDWDTVQSGIKTAVSEISAARMSESLYDTVKAIHDYVCDNLSNHVSDEWCGEQQCAAPIFGGGSIGKEGVCEGYAMTFKLLCDQFNVPAAVIGSRSHAYNYVQMDDGIYYLIDCTWDDPQDNVSYEFFLVGTKTILHGYSCWRVDSDYDHMEYWYFNNDGLDHAPVVYPAVSEHAYSMIELTGGIAGTEKAISGTATLKFRYKGNDFAGKKASVCFQYHSINTSDIDENGLFEATVDTTQYYNGYNYVTAQVGDQSFYDYVYVDNPTFEILDWGNEIPAISEPYKVSVKGYSSGNITDCKIEVWMDCWTSDYGEYIRTKKEGTYRFDKDGIASFVIDPRKLDEGLHSVCVVFSKPGGNSNSDRANQRESRSFRISHTAADSGKFRFWGHSAQKDRTVGEWADFTLKYDGVVTERCKFDVTIDDVPVTPLRQGEDKVTDFFDKDGYCTFYLDVNGQSNGEHTVRATLTKEDGSSVTASNTVYTTDGYFNYRLSVSEGFIIMDLKNISEEPADKCQLKLFEDDMIACDRMLTNDYLLNFWEDDTFHREQTVPYINFGSHVMKVVVKTPDGALIEKNLPFTAQAVPRYDDIFCFCVTNHKKSSTRNVGSTADFSLQFTSPYHVCKKLSVTLDGNPVDIQIPDGGASAFDYFGRFLFTLDFTEAEYGKHTLEAFATREDGVEMTAKQEIIVTDDGFEITNWPGENPVLKRVYDVKFKKLTASKPADTESAETEEVVCSVRQYIDGEDMGAAVFDENGDATLSLNTAGLESGEHLYKAVFSDSKGEIIERIMRFHVE